MHNFYPCTIVNYVIKTILILPITLEFTHIVQGPYDLIIQAYNDFFEANGSLEKQKKNNQQTKQTFPFSLHVYMYIHIFHVPSINLST